MTGTAVLSKNFIDRVCARDRLTRAVIISIDLPPDLEKRLREETPNLDSVAREAFLIMLYQQGRLYHKQLGELLGLDRWKTEELLHRHGVSDLTPEEIDRQFETIRRMGV